MNSIQTTLGEIVLAERALQKVLSVKLDAKVRYHVLKLASLVAVEVKHFFSEHSALVKELGNERQATTQELAKGSEATVYQVPLEKMKLFTERFNELQAVPVKLDWGPLTTAMVEPYEDITADVLLGLGPLYQLDPPEELKQTR